MATPGEMFDALCVRIKAAIPKFETRWKAVVWLDVAIAAAIWLFNPTFLTRYITTLYPRVDFPREGYRDEDGMWQVLAHEFVHLHDRKRLGLLFVFLYGFPQILTPLALLAFVGIWWKWALFALLFLACAAPWPAPGRVWAELRGYTMTMAVMYWSTGAVPDDAYDWIQGQFTGWPYYKMSWRSPDAMKAALRAQVDLIKSGKILEGDANAPFPQVKALIDGARTGSG